MSNDGFYKPDNDDAVPDATTHSGIGLFGALLALVWMVIFLAFTATTLVVMVKVLIWAIRWQV